MRGCWATILALSAIFGPIASVQADDIPNLHVEQVCHGIVSQSTDPLAGGETDRRVQSMHGRRAARSGTIAERVVDLFVRRQEALYFGIPNGR